MQKHQEWLDNRNYEQHLLSLMKIKQNTRKNHIKSAIHGRRRRISNKQLSQDQIHPSVQHHQHSHKIHSPKVHKNIQITTRQKQLLWNNFLLGKRIIQTNPVISVKKHQDQYKKHKKILDARFQRNKKYAQNTQFRQTKLKQYQINTHRLTNCFRLPTTGNGRFVLTLKIIKIEFLYHKTLEDIVLKMKYQNKKLCQISQIVNVQNLQFYEFYFKYSVFKDKQTESNGVQFDLYEMKKLDQRHVGCFFVSKENITSRIIYLTSELKKVGKIIGEVKFQVSISKKNILKQSL